MVQRLQCRHEPHTSGEMPLASRELLSRQVRVLRQKAYRPIWPLQLSEMLSGGALVGENLALGIHYTLVRSKTCRTPEECLAKIGVTRDLLFRGSSSPFYFEFTLLLGEGVNECFGDWRRGLHR